MQQLEMVFNELSLGTSIANQAVATDKQQARELMSIFINTLSTAVNSGVTILRTQIDIYSIMLTPSYPVANWVNDTQIDEAEQTFLLTLETERPLLSNLKDPKIENQINLFQCQHSGNEASGLGIAYLLEALPVSLIYDRQWDCSYLTLDITQLDENDELVEEQVEIVHASRSEHINPHSALQNVVYLVVQTLAKRIEYKYSIIGYKKYEIIENEFRALGWVKNERTNRSKKLRPLRNYSRNSR